MPRGCFLLGSLLGAQMPVFPRCPHLACPLCLPLLVSFGGLHFFPQEHQSHWSRAFSNGLIRASLQRPRPQCGYVLRSGARASTNGFGWGCNSP